MGEILEGLAWGIKWGLVIGVILAPFYIHGFILEERENSKKKKEEAKIRKWKLEQIKKEE